MGKKISPELASVAKEIKNLIKKSDWTSFLLAAQKICDVRSPEVTELFISGLGTNEIGAITIEKFAVICEILPNENFLRESAAFCILATTGKLDNLLSLNLSRYDGKNLSFITRLKKLKNIYLGKCTLLTDIEGIENLKNLRGINFDHCEKLENIAPIGVLNKLTQLSMFGCSSLVDISPLRSLGGLKELCIAHSKVFDLGPLQDLSKLNALSLWGCRELRSLSPLAHLSSLKKLDLAECSELTDISPLSKLVNLLDIRVVRCPGISDYGPLNSLPKLNKDYLNNTIFF